MYQQTSSYVRTSQIQQDLRENCCILISLIEKFSEGSAFLFKSTSTKVEYFHNECFILSAHGISYTNAANTMGSENSVYHSSNLRHSKD